MKLKLFDIIAKVGKSAIKAVMPGSVGAVLDAVNSLLPKDKQLGDSATGDDISAAIESLPPDQRAGILSKELDVELTEIKESYSTARAMLEAERLSTHTTRPEIALGAFRLVAAITLMIVSGWLVAVVKGDAVMAETIQGGAVWVGVLLVPFIAWIDRYFGKLTREHKTRVDAVTGNSTPGGVLGILSNIIKR